MIAKELAGKITGITGKMFKGNDFARLNIILKRYPEEQLNNALTKLFTHPAPHTIPSPISWIEKICSAENNKTETENILNNLL